MERRITWKCLNCKDSPVMDHLGFLKHLEDVHHQDASKPIQCKSESVMFLDGRGFHKQIYKITIGDLAFEKTFTLTKDGRS